MVDNPYFWELLSQKEQDEIREIVQNSEYACRFLEKNLSSAGFEKYASSHSLRAKTNLSIARKLVMGRKKYGHNSRLDKLNDYVGLRLIVNFESQLEDICKQIEKNFCPEAAPLKDGPFVKGSLYQVFIYESSFIGTDSPGKEIYYHLNSLGERKGFSVKLETKHGLYSGIHFLGRLYCDENASDNKVDHHTVAFEVQARTIFEDAWSEIAHKIYEIDREEISSESYEEKIDARTRQHLDVLKNMLDAASRYTVLIKQQVHEDVDGNEKIDRNPNKPDLSSPEEIQGILSSHDIPVEEVNKFMALFNEKAQIDKLKPKEREAQKRARRYLELADSFSDLRNRIIHTGSLSKVEECAYSKAQHVFFYYLSLEEPLCRLFSNNDEEVKKARALYLDLERDFPDSATVKFRLGQSYERLLRFDKAIQKYHESYTHMRQLRGVPEEDRQLSLTPCQQRYLENNLARMLSFAHWIRARQSMRQDEFEPREVCGCFMAAYQFATEGLADWQDQSEDSKPYRKRLLNSGIYFGAEVLLHEPTKRNDISGLYTELVSEFAQMVDHEEPKDLRCLDTLSYAYFVLGEQVRAKKLAEIILGIIAKSDDPRDLLKGEKYYTRDEQLALIMDRANKLSRDASLKPQFILDG